MDMLTEKMLGRTIVVRGKQNQVVLVLMMASSQEKYKLILENVGQELEVHIFQPSDPVLDMVALFESTRRNMPRKCPVVLKYKK